MRFSHYFLASGLALLGGLSSISLSGCGANKSLGGGSPEDAGAGGTGGVTTITGGTAGGATSTVGGTSAAGATVGGAGAAGATAAAGQTTVASSVAPGGSTAVAGKTAAGGASASSSAGTAGTTSVAGKTASGGSAIGGGSAGGIVALGGSTLVSTGASGGSAGSGGGTSGGTGVILTATLLEDTVTIQATWQNNTQASIFLYGCGTVDVYRKEATGWTNIGKPMACAWEGISPEVKPGASFTDPSYGPFTKWWPVTGGTFRLSGKYGVGCTNPSAGQSKAGCTSFIEATSNEIAVAMPVPDAGVDVACGAMEGVTCKKPTGGCAAMICVNGSWACAAGQTPVALVPGACDTPDAAVTGQ